MSDARGTQISLKFPYIQATFNDPGAPRIRELIERAIAARGIGDGFYELEDLIIITKFSWPALKEWERRFDALNYQPRNWARAESLEILPELSGSLAYLASLRVEDRKMLLTPPFPMPRSWFIERFGADVMERSLASGALRRVVAFPEKLQHVPLEQLRRLQRILSVRGGRSRADVARVLCLAAPEQKLVRLLQPEYSEEMIEVSPGSGRPTLGWISTRRSLARCYLITMTTCLNSIRNAEASIRIGVGVKVLDVSSDCPVCGPHQGKVIELRDGCLPPFHPGCVCCTFVDVKWPTEAGSG